MEFNWQQSGWPRFSYRKEELTSLFLRFSESMGEAKALFDTVGDQQATADEVAEEALLTSHVEGVRLSADSVQSSVFRLMGVVPRKGTGSAVRDIRAEGVASMLVAVREQWRRPLSEPLLLGWHKRLFLGVEEISAGAYRSSPEPMRVIAMNAFGEADVRYEAPPSKRVPAEMKAFVHDFAEPSGQLPPDQLAARVALAHLRFECIHPFEDGNGRIGRALVAKLLAEGMGRPLVLPFSVQIMKRRKAYYEAIRNASFALEQTDWIAFFTDLLTKSFADFSASLRFAVQKAAFLSRFEETLSARQLHLVRRMLAEGAKGFEGGISAAKYMRIEKVSKATATRDLAQLRELGALRRIGHGRAAHYELAL